MEFLFMMINIFGESTKFLKNMDVFKACRKHYSLNFPINFQENSIFY